MLPSTVIDAGPVPAERAGTTTIWPLAFALAGVASPLAPRILYSTAALPLDPVAHTLSVAAGICVAFAVPLAGLALLWMSTGRRDTGALRARGIGMLLVIAPVLTALGTTWAAAAGLRASALPIWVGCWTAATLGVAWRSSVAEPILPVAINRRVRQVHRTFVALLLLFAAAHLAVNLTALRDLAVYNQAAGWFRLAWRTRIGEPILIALLATQLVTGLTLALDASIGRSTFEHLCQITAGLFIAVFLTSHTFAVAVLGRQLLNRGPAFTFASGGPGGLLASAQSATLFPYYGLAVVALFVHLARPLRLYLSRTIGPAQGRLAAGVLVGAGFVVSALLLVALVHPGR